MYSKINYTIVGIFVLLFGLGMVAFSFWLAKYGLHQEYDLYKTYMKESVAGLSKDSVVRLRGVDVGRVKEIRIDPNNVERVEILLNIKHGTPIKEDMVAHTSMLGVTGLLSIEIEGGTNGSKMLRPSKEHIPVIASSASWFDETKKEIGTLAQRLSLFTEKMQKVLSDENVDHFSNILANTDQLTHKSVALADEMNATLETYREAAKKVNHDLERLTRSFEKISDESIPAIRKIKETSKNFNRVALKVERSLDRGDYSIKKTFEPILVDIEILSNQISALAKELDESPSDILFKSRQRRKGPGE